MAAGWLQTYCKAGLAKATGGCMVCASAPGRSDQALMSGAGRQPYGNRAKNSSQDCIPRQHEAGAMDVAASYVRQPVIVLIS